MIEEKIGKVMDQLLRSAPIGDSIFGYRSAKWCVCATCKPRIVGSCLQVNLRDPNIGFLYTYTFIWRFLPACIHPLVAMLSTLRIASRPTAAADSSHRFDWQLEDVVAHWLELSQVYLELVLCFV